MISRKIVECAKALAAGAVCSLTSVPALGDELQSFYVGSPAVLVAPGTEDGLLASSATPATHEFLGANERSWEVEALARSLQYDPAQMFAFVRNEVDLHPVFGLQKGARGAAIDLSGTTFDQADLLVQLLRTPVSDSFSKEGATVTSANYVYGTVTLSGADFEDWFGVSDAKSACRLLAAGGFPARVNGDTGCTTLTGMVTSVEIAHIWVTAVVGGQTVIYDPAFKRYQEYAGLNLAAEMNYTAGDAYTTATASTGSQSGVPFAQNINFAGLETLLVNRSNSLRTTFDGSANYDRSLDDLVGARRIIQWEPFMENAEPPGVGPGTLSGTVWSEIPDHYRTTLTLQVGRCSGTNCTGNSIEMIETFFVDEIYGSQLALQPNDFGQPTSTPLGTIDQCQLNFGAYDYQVHFTVDGLNVPANPGNTTNLPNNMLGFAGDCEPLTRRDFDIEVEVNHPYAHSSGSYMDRRMYYEVDLVTKASLVAGFGAVTPGYEAHMRRVSPAASQLPYIYDFLGSEFDQYFPPLGTDHMRDGVGASWLSQAWRMMDLQARMADAHAQHHHSIGFVHAATEMSHRDDCTLQGGILSCGRRQTTISDESLLISAGSSVSLSLDQYDAMDKRGLDFSVASVAAMLEAAVVQQMTDAVNPIGSAAKFAWANGGPDAVLNQPSGYSSMAALEDNDQNSATGFAGTEEFFVFETGDQSLVNTLITTDGLTSCPLGETDTYRCQGGLMPPITTYLDDGFVVIAPGDRFLGPGRRCTGWRFGVSNYICDRNMARGGAMIAYKTTSDGVEIAHIATSNANYLKGAGGPTTPEEFDLPSLPTAADLLEQSAQIDFASNVNLQTGQADISTGPLLTTGAGEFPYSLSFQMSMGTGTAAPYADPWKHNWDMAATLSSSANEAMGSGRASAAIPSLVAFHILQDLHRSSTGTTAVRARREVAAQIVTNWLSRQMLNNVVTVTHGGSSTQFTRWLETSEFLPPATSNAELIQTGSRFVAQPIDMRKSPVGLYNPGALTWFDNDLSFRFSTPDGQEIDFEYWSAVYLDVDSQIFSFSSEGGLKRGFRATEWRFPTGMSVDFNYEDAISGCGTYSGGPNHPNARRCEQRLASVVTSLGRRLDFEYETDTDNLLGVRDENNRYAGRHNGEMHAFENAAGEVTHFDVELIVGDAVTTTEDPKALARFVTAIRRPEDPVGQPSLRYGYGYDPADPFNSSWRVTYVEHRRAGGSYGQTRVHADAGGREGATKRPNSYVYHTHFDEYGRQVATVNDSRTVNYSYHDGIGRVVETRNRASYGNPGYYLERRTIEYDQRHNVRFQRREPRTLSSGVPYTAPALVTEYRYEDANWPDLPTSVIDPEGEVSTTQYHPTFGYATVVTGPEGERTEFQYNANGLMDLTRIKVDATRWRETEVFYDAMHQPDYALLSGTGAPYTLRTDFTWTAEGWLETLSTPHPTLAAQSITSRADYDGAGRITHAWLREGRPEEERMEFIHDGNGRVERVRRSGDLGVTWIESSATYAPWGGALTLTDPDGDTTTIGYNSTGEVDYVDDPLGRRTSYRINSDGLVWCERRARGTSEEITYMLRTIYTNGDTSRFMSARADVDHDCSYGDQGDSGYNNQTLFALDIYGRSDRVFFPDFNTPYAFSDNFYTRSYFNPDGTLDFQRNRAGEFTYFSYDRSNRELARQTPDADFGFTYDLTGAQLSAEIDEGANGTIEARRTQTYDVFGRLETETIHFDNATTSFTTTYEYDRAGNRSAIIWPDGWAARYAYDTANRLVEVCEDSDGNGTCERVLSDFAYDGLGRPMRAEYGHTGASQIYYAHEADGDRNAQRHVFGSTVRDFAHSYDAAGQLTATYASDSSWVWSASAARTVTYDPANERNELTGYTDNGAVTALSYDDNGNLVGDGVADFHVHNAQNQLISAVRGSDTASFLYGPNGRRVEMSINGVRTRLVHAGDMEIAELTEISGQWKIKTRYVPAAGIDRRVAMITVNTANGATLAREYYHHDRLGSVRAMVSETGSVLAYYVYTPFGVEDYGASGNPFRFTGQRYDAAIRLYYYRARYYDPELGRFLQTDPILYEDQMNLYAYVSNSPLMATDPTGMYEVEECGNECIVYVIEARPGTAAWNEEVAEIGADLFRRANPDATDQEADRFGSALQSAIGRAERQRAGHREQDGAATSSYVGQTYTVALDGSENSRTGYETGIRTGQYPSYYYSATTFHEGRGYPDVDATLWVPPEHRDIHWTQQRGNRQSMGRQYADQGRRNGRRIRPLLNYADIGIWLSPHRVGITAVYDEP